MEPVKKGEIPFVRIVIPMILGISTAYWYTSSLQLLVFINYLLLALLVCFLLGIFLYEPWKLYRYKWLIGSNVFLLIFLAAYARTIHTSQKVNEFHFSKMHPELLIVNINSEPGLVDSIMHFDAIVSYAIINEKIIHSTGKLLLSVKLEDKSLSNYRYGTRLVIPAKFTSVDPPYNPFEFDYRAYLANKAIYHRAFFNERQIKILERDKGNRIIAYAFKTRQQLVERFSKYIVDRNAAAIAATLILGYKADLSQEIINAYSITGTMHVLSVSGMHVGIIYIILAFIFKRLDSSRKARIIRATIIITIIFAYTVLSGLSAAACRAALMISFFILGKALSRSQNSYNLVAISAVILLLYNPFFLVDVGFQLSYFAVLGLIYFYPKIYHAMYFKNYPGDKIWSYSALSISAQLATFPISIYYFHQFPVYFLVANLFIVLPVALIMYVGVLFIFLPFDLTSQPVGWLLEQCIVLTNDILSRIGNLPAAAITGIWIKTGECLLIYLLFILLLISIINKAKREFFLSMLVLFILACSFSLERVLKERKNKIIVYSLRKNYAIGLFEGRKAYLFTDMKPSDKGFSFSVKPSLDESLISKVLIQRLGQSIENNTIFSDGNFIQFRGWKIFIWDKSINRTGSSPVYVDAVLIKDNPRISIESVRKTFRFKYLIFGASNYDSNINRWVEEARRLNLEYYILKKKPCFEIKM